MELSHRRLASDDRRNIERQLFYSLLQVYKYHIWEYLETIPAAVDYYLWSVPQLARVAHPRLRQLVLVHFRLEPELPLYTRTQSKQVRRQYNRIRWCFPPLATYLYRRWRYRWLFFSFHHLLCLQKRLETGQTASMNDNSLLRVAPHRVLFVIIHWRLDYWLPLQTIPLRLASLHSRYCRLLRPLGLYWLWSCSSRTQPSRWFDWADRHLLHLARMAIPIWKTAFAFSLCLFWTNANSRKNSTY